MKTTLLSACLAIAPMAGASATAATVSMDTFSSAGFLAAAGGATDATMETFESYRAGSWGAATTSNVGTFASAGGTGSGKTCRILTGAPTCRGLQLQDRDMLGQGNVVPDRGIFSLSSADTFGIVWDVFTRTGALFNSVVFGLRDAADIPGTVFSLTVDGVTRTAEQDGNGKLVKIDFGRNVRNATIRLVNADANGALRINDSFTIDGAAIVPSPVPLPAGFLPLGGALAGIGALRRRKTAA